MMPSEKQLGKFAVIGIIVAGALLNIGLYFILFFIAPILVGAVVGYLMHILHRALLGSFLSGLLAYLPLELLTAPTYIQYLVDEGVYSVNEIAQNLANIYFQLISASVILALLCLVGGYLGLLIRRRIS
ncbi:hypothetical protein EU537_03555 [Candidatus Thorarchaeota archaeon]|nr:MAG: hypothetical protein EU537_03555 [Candidatus Thorarchaeota archaeon]